MLFFCALALREESVVIFGSVHFWLLLLVLLPGIEQGTVVITDRAVDGLLRPFYELVSLLPCHWIRIRVDVVFLWLQYILGKVVRRPALFDLNLIQELKGIAADIDEFPTVTGTTMCALDFYESQARLDGAFCSITGQQKMDYLNRLRDEGVVNIEMEAVTFASMCHYQGIEAAIICVTLLNRLNGDQIESTKEFLNQLQTRPQVLAAKFIKKRLAQYNNRGVQ